LLLLPVVVLATLFLPAAHVAAAQTVPYKVNFQGRLTDSSGMVLSGTYDMQFKLYTAVTGGTIYLGGKHELLGTGMLLQLRTAYLVYWLAKERP